jgi:hypothetical protein
MTEMCNTGLLLLPLSTIMNSLTINEVDYGLVLGSIMDVHGIHIDKEHIQSRVMHNYQLVWGVDCLLL